MNILDEVVVGRPLGTTEWIKLVAYRDYNSHVLKGYFKDGDKKKFYLPDQVELRRYIDLDYLKAEIAKNCLYQIIRHEGCADDRNVDHVTKENQVSDAIKYANLFIEALTKKKDTDA
jgi:hypothetical protein